MPRLRTNNGFHLERALNIQARQPHPPPLLGKHASVASNCRPSEQQAEAQRSLSLLVFTDHLGYSLNIYFSKPHPNLLNTNLPAGPRLAPARGLRGSPWCCFSVLCPEMRQEAEAAVHWEMIHCPRREV